MRYEANVAYMRRHVGSPGILALRALVFNVALGVPILYFLYCGVPMPTFLLCTPIVGIVIVARVLAAYLDGGRHDT